MGESRNERDDDEEQTRQTLDDAWLIVLRIEAFRPLLLRPWSFSALKQAFALYNQVDFAAGSILFFSCRDFSMILLVLVKLLFFSSSSSWLEEKSI